MLISTPPKIISITTLLASSVLGETPARGFPPNQSSTRLLRSFPLPSIYPFLNLLQSRGRYQCPSSLHCLSLWPGIVWGCCQITELSPDPGWQQGTGSFHLERPLSAAGAGAAGPAAARPTVAWVTGTDGGLAVSGSSPDTRAVRGALITLMWGLGRVALCSEEGCDAGAGSERHYRGNGGTAAPRRIHNL